MGRSDLLPIQPPDEIFARASGQRVPDGSSEAGGDAAAALESARRHARQIGRAARERDRAWEQGGEPRGRAPSATTMRGDADRELSSTGSAGADDAH